MWKVLAIAEQGLNKQLRRQDAVAQNLANVNTTGYKRKICEEKDFKACVQNSFDNRLCPAGDTNTYNDGGLLDTGVMDLTQGSLVQTDSALSLAINGKGFFKLLTPSGVQYTRNGNFTLDAEGTVVSHDGFPVLGTGGPIRVDGKKIEVMSDGTVRSDEDIVGKISVVDFPEPVNLTQAGDHLMSSQETPEETTSDAGILSGYLESSNVNALTEMVRMIESMRYSQMNEKVIKTADELLDKINNQLGKVR